MADKPENYKKYLIIYLSCTFGLCWGVSLLYVLFYDTMVSIFGELTLQNPIVILALNSPSIVGFIIYYIYGRFDGLKKYILTIIPRKKDLKWIPIIIVSMVIYVISIRVICLAVGIEVPEMTLTNKQRVVYFLKNIYEEIGMLGGAWGWFGFLLPYLQRKYNDNLKAGLLTGLTLGLFVLPGYAFSSFETATAYPFYVIQLMIFSVSIGYILNDTKGNVLFYLLAFWIMASGSKLQLYYFVPSVQIIETSLIVIIYIALRLWFKHRYVEHPEERELQKFPDFIER